MIMDAHELGMCPLCVVFACANSRCIEAEGAQADFCIAFEGGVEEDGQGSVVCFAVVAWLSDIFQSRGCGCPRYPHPLRIVPMILATGQRCPSILPGLRPISR